MATTANSLRLCARTSGQISGLKAAPRQALLLRRALSTTPTRQDDEHASGEAAPTRKYYDTVGDVLKDLSAVSANQRRAAARMMENWDKLPAEEVAKLDKLTKDVISETAAIRRPVQRPKQTFWNSAEPDPDYITDEVGEDDWEENDIMSLAHGKLEEHREYREYARIAVWEMPLLSKFARPFQPPKDDEVLRFRYTTYMGEIHPAAKKVVVEFSPKDLKGLTEIQQQKLMKLAGSRYNPEKEIIKMSCEQFEHQAQNKRYLGDLVNNMITMAKDPTDTFEDIPLDTRHHKFKVKHKFPKEWLLTEERKKEIEEERKRSYLLDQQKKTDGGLIDGLQTIKERVAPKIRIPEPVGVRGARAPYRQAR